jgi:hypothetical protein
MNLKVRGPIVVVGTGRSGSTVVFDILARHPQVAWLSRLAGDYPDRFSMNIVLMRARSYAIVDSLPGRHLGPSEAYSYWDLNCPGFSNPYRDLLANDVAPIAAFRLRESIAPLLTRKRSRFVAKITDWACMQYLWEIFSQAFFIEVKRNPCAPGSSLLEVPFWDGSRGPPNWRRGPLPADLDAIWLQEGESFVALLLLQYVIVQRAIAECCATPPAAQMHTVSNSQLCADPVGVFQDATK